jgi:hypothetical protein
MYLDLPGEAERPRLAMSVATLDVSPSNSLSNVSSPDGSSPGETPAVASDAALRDLIWRIFYNGASPEKYAENLITFYQHEYVETADGLMDYPDIPPATMNWDYTETMETSFPATDRLVISRSREYYMGGAHGMQEKKYAVIDTQAIRELHLEDIIRGDARPDLIRWIEGELRTLAGLDAAAPLSDGGFFDDSVGIPENFFLTTEGLGFHWDPYEIAPYVMGPLEIIIPKEKIRDLASPGY